MRRGHGSTKVPNVKLRPAPTRASSSQGPTVVVAIDEEDEQQLVGSEDQPFKNVLLALTGVSDKGELLKLATALGASIDVNLTTSTTHLVAGNTQSVKYKIALQKQIPIMSSSWIVEAHKVWIEGCRVDFEDSVVRHRLLPFQSLSICLTHMDDNKHRQAIEQGVIRYGGAYSKVIQKGRTTHLLCGGDGGGTVSEKFKIAKKHNELQSRMGEEATPIRIVWEEWLWDCIEFGGRWPEDEYLIHNPRPKRKEPPANLTTANVNQICADSALDLNCLAPTSETVSVSSSHLSRVGSQRVLEGLIRNRKDWKVENGRISSSVSGSALDDGQSVGGSTAISDTASDKTRLSRVAYRTNSFMMLAGTGSSSSGEVYNKRTPLQTVMADAAAVQSKLKERAIFDGKKFLLLGEADAPQVVSTIRKLGGIVLEDKSNPGSLDLDYVITRLASGGRFYNTAPSHIQAKFRTECWLERCLSDSTICEVEDHPLFTPITIPRPLAWNEGKNPHVICWSGLDQEQIMWSRRVVGALGISNPPQFSSKCTHLVCPSREGKKYEKALEWGVEVVDLEWLWNLARKGLGDSVPTEDSSTVPYCPPNDNGKGKATIDVTAIIDITNSTERRASQSSSSASKSSTYSRKRGLGCTVDHRDIEHDTSNLTFGTPYLLSSQSLPMDSVPPIKRSRTVIEPMQSTVSIPFQPSNLAKSGTFSNLKQPQNPTTPPANKNQIVSSSVSTSSATPVAVRNRETSQEPTRTSSKPPSLSKHVTRELHSTISDLLNRANTSDLRSEDDPEKVSSRRERPARTRSGNNLVSVLTNKHPVPAPIIEVPDEELDSKGKASESVRVMYRDPDQAAEQKKLMRLLSGSSPTSSRPETRERKRRNGKTRTPGF